MDNVLDLKNPPEEVEELPVQGIPSETEFGFTPSTIEWEAHHPLQGASLRRHTILLGALVGIGALVAWWQASITVFLVTLVGVGALEAKERWGKPTRVAIDERGIALNGHHCPHTDFASFDIHRMPDDTVELSLHTTKWHAPHLRLPLGKQNPDDVRTVLLQYIPEDRHTIPLWDYFIRKS